MQQTGSNNEIHVEVNDSKNQNQTNTDKNKTPLPSKIILLIFLIITNIICLVNFEKNVNYSSFDIYAIIIACTYFVLLLSCWIWIISEYINQNFFRIISDYLMIFVCGFYTIIVAPLIIIVLSCNDCIETNFIGVFILFHALIISPTCLIVWTGIIIFGLAYTIIFFINYLIVLVHNCKTKKDQINMSNVSCEVVVSN